LSISFTETEILIFLSNQSIDTTFLPFRNLDQDQQVELPLDNQKRRDQIRRWTRTSRGARAPKSPAKCSNRGSTTGSRRLMQAELGELLDKRRRHKEQIQLECHQIIDLY